ncbi:hypothetical protein [Streptomyces sp. DSM 40750]|uniref:hypothetical protein n=1 Tax=Streptomyces sp. DSM 40750 TaxID=2801030 RepID=UPI00214BF79C|nr:hypothetical protein [Streptomyces sp. DSM 40750]UUU19167.1 hypothetical protein JIX55_01835 [Streptomyces sp. DSM 40750]UUU27489.1 hypothetical protein JIX55_48910 [Streptomyces sp. DSM 40750]
MDEYAEFRQLARKTVELLQADPSKKKSKVSADNIEVEGWTIDHGSSYSKETLFSKAPGDFKEVWGNNGEIILGEDAEIYSFSWHKEESGWPTVMKESSSLRKLEARDLVGGKGKPFSEYTNKLNRLRWS